MQDYLNNLKKKTYTSPSSLSYTPQLPSVTQNFIAPKPTTTATPASTSATNTTPPPVTNPAVKSDAGQKFVSSIQTPQNNQINGALTKEQIANGSTPTPTVTAPATGTTPTDTRKAYISYLTGLNNNVAGLSTPSTAETEAEKKYRDFTSSAESGIAGLEGQGRGIPLGLVRGQQEKLGKQAEITAKRLQGDVDMAQNERTANLNAAKLASDNAKPLQFGDEYVDPKTGEIIYTKPKEVDELANKKFQLEQDKFNQDKKEFGMEYALKKQEADTKANAAGAGTPSVQNSLTQLSFLKDTADQALERADASGPSGISKILGGIFIGDTKYKQLESLTNTLRTNVLTLMTDPSIKKFFGPQMSEADVKLMTAAGTTLNPEDQSPELLKTEIRRLQNLFGRMEASLKGADTSKSYSEEEDLKKMGYSDEQIEFLKAK